MINVMRKDLEKLWNFKDFVTNFDYKKLDNVEVDGIDTKDYPDFCDAYIASATYDGRNMTEEELEYLNEDRDYVYEFVMNELF